MKILVIEDEKMLADSIKSMLERKGFQVDCVYDGESGKEFAVPEYMCRRTEEILRCTRLAWEERKAK